jgi:hypothetical protein
MAYVWHNALEQKLILYFHRMLLRRKERRCGRRPTLNILLDGVVISSRVQYGEG